MRAYTHGGGAHRQRVGTTFWLGKTFTNFPCAPDGIRTSIWSWNPLDFEADALPREPPRPRMLDIYNVGGLWGGVVEERVQVHTPFENRGLVARTTKGWVASQLLSVRGHFLIRFCHLFQNPFIQCLKKQSGKYILVQGTTMILSSWNNESYKHAN